MNNNNRRRRPNQQHHHNRYHQESQSPTSSRYRKPPRVGNNWHQTVPPWEKQFCYAVGSIPWRKLLETKKLMYLYENVVQWNDSAGEEAFYNAKNRFWAEINGLPCNMSLPDPDIYIDEVNWNCDIDPELLLDLEREPEVTEERADQQEVVIFGSSLFPDPPISCMGWGDDEEEPQKTGGNQEHGNVMNSYDNPWDGNHLQASGVTENNVGDNSWKDSQGWGNYHNEWEKTGYQWDTNNHHWNNVNDKTSHKWETWDDDNGNNHHWNNANDKTSHEWETWDDDNGNKEDSGCHMSRYKTNRFPKDDEYQSDRGWWPNGRGRKRVSFAY